MGFFSKIWEKIKVLKTQTNYVILFSIVFGLGMLFHFPLEKFSSVLTTNIQRQTGYIVQMEKMSLTFPVGLTAQTVRIQPPPGTPDPFVLNIDKLTVRPSLWALVTYPFRKAVGFSYKAIRGKETWSGSASLGNENSSVDISVENFNWSGVIPLDQNPMFAGQVVKIDTTVNIDLSLAGKTVALQQGNLSEAEGSLDIHSKKTDIEAPFVKVLNMSDFTLESVLKKGSFDINKLNFTAPNLSGKSSGNIKIEPFFPNSKLKMDVTLKADPSDPNLSASLQAAGALLNVTPTPDGTISLKINGPLNSPERLSIKSF